jgi:hypothetical protein
LEFARGTIYSLSKKNDGHFEAVHVSRIQRSFARLEAAHSLFKVGLRLLELLREAEPLFGGYWLPAPLRSIEIDGEHVFIGAVPNAYGILGTIRTEGLARILTRDIAQRFPIQSLDSWMGNASIDSTALAAKFVANHLRTATKTSHLSDVEYLSVVTRAVNMQPQFFWNVNATPTLPNEQIAICKQLLHGHTRYFSASLCKGQIVSEATIDLPIRKLMFSIARHIGTPIKIVSRSTSKGVEFKVSERLPIEEFRLSLLLSRYIDREGRSTTFALSPKLASAFSTRLAALGCTMETLQ